MCNVKVNLTKPLAFLLLFSLISCGGSENSHVFEPTQTPISVEALNGTASATINKPSTIDVAPFIYGDKDNIEIDVFNLNKQDCPTPIVSNLSFKITANVYATCNYQYDIKQKNNAAVLSSAEMQILVTKSEMDAYLSPMNAATIVNDPFTLVTNWDAIEKALEGYYISEESFVVHALSSAEKGDIDYQEGPVLGLPWINFKSPSTPGWNYISYVAENNNLGEEKFGYIFITIADEANQAPEITKDEVIFPTSHHFDLDDKSSIASGENHNISVANLVTVEEGEKWFLDSVISMSADVEVSSQHSFSFNAPTNGEHYVTYVVRDERGAYSLGSMKVIVATPRDWHDQTFNISEHLAPETLSSRQENLDEVTFIAPLTKADAANLVEQSTNAISWQEKAAEEMIGDKRYEVSLWTLKEAQSYCESFDGGRIPTSEEFIHFLNTNNENSKTWPDDIEYFVLDNNQNDNEPDSYKSISLASGNSVTKLINKDSLRYVSCLRYNGPAINVYIEKPIATAGKPIGIDFELTLKNNPLEGINIYGSLIKNDNCSDDDKRCFDSEAIIACDIDQDGVFEQGINVDGSGIENVLLGTTNDEGELHCQYTSEVATREGQKFKMNFKSAATLLEWQLIKDIKIGVDPDVAASVGVQKSDELNIENGQPTLRIKPDTLTTFTLDQFDQYRNCVNGLWAYIKTNNNNDVQWLFHKQGSALGNNNVSQWKLNHKRDFINLGCGTKIEVCASQAGTGTIIIDNINDRVANQDKEFNAHDNKTNEKNDWGKVSNLSINVIVEGEPNANANKCTATKPLSSSSYY